jgi:glycosyltransferase involved in cell wall biosynthesis
MNERKEWIALLGRRDSPTDALRDYCSCLGRALERQGVRLEQVEVPWAERGWWSALTQLSRDTRSWQRKWVLLQYTALSWSRRGFPFGALALVWLLKRRGLRCVIVFHDSNAYSGRRLRERIRRSCQLWVMKSAYRLATRAIFTEPMDRILWLPAQRAKAAFIPIGANIPESLNSRTANGRQASGTKTIAIFSITGGSSGPREVADIAYAVKQVKAQVRDLRLVVFGRGSEDAREPLERAFNGSGLEIAIRGILPAEEVTRTLSGADVLLFVRGEVSSRRGSALAGVACGLPIVGYGDRAGSFPVSEAGTQLVPPGNQDALASALGRVLADDTLWSELHERSRRAHATYFSWEVIARQFRTVLEQD